MVAGTTSVNTCFHGIASVATKNKSIIYDGVYEESTICLMTSGAIIYK